MRVAVIGGGPAGLMAAGRAAECGASVVIFDRNPKLGKKLYITGKGRCNLTNLCSTEKFLESVVSNPKFLISAINGFSPQDAVDFFEGCGLQTLVERGNRVFPASGKASDVTRALERYCAGGAVEVRLDAFVKAIVPTEFGFNVITEAAESFDRVVIATGGCSYPLTGSDGSGFSLARMTGHTVIAPRPALVPITLVENVSQLQGLSLVNVSVSVQRTAVFGEMLFTDEGITGPAVLSLSSFINSTQYKGAQLEIDLKPALDHAKLDARLLRDFSANQNKQILNVMPLLVPRALSAWVVGQAGVDGTKPCNSITKTERTALVSALKGLRFTIADLGDIERGIVTAGGVDVRQINPKTMQSKLCTGLYFCGEMIDVDALTGGYNIQIALSTAFAAGTSCALD